MEIKSTQFEVKEIRADGTFAGYGSVFGNIDSYDDVIVKGAFKDTLNKARAKGRMPALLWQHDTSKPIGVFTSMVEDEYGLYVEGKLLKDDVAQAKEAYALLKAGALSGMSIGFYIKDGRMDTESGLRYLTEIDLFEVSLVTFPANDDARITGVKQLKTQAGELPSIKEFEAFLRDAGGFSRGQAKAIAGHGYRALERDAQSDETDAVNSLQSLVASLKGNSK